MERHIGFDGMVHLMLNEHYLNEEKKIIKNFPDFIENVAKKLNDDFANNSTPAGIWYTGWVYIPNITKCIEVKEESESYEQGFPIYINYIFNPMLCINMQMESREYNPERIIITVNVFYIRECNLCDVSELASKLKHEFTHVREVYGRKELDTSKNRKMMSDDVPNFFNLDVNSFKVVGDYLYYFSKTEMDARVNGAEELINFKWDDEIEEIIKGCKDYKEKMFKLIEYTESEHWISKGREYVSAIQHDLKIKDGYGIQFILIVAYYFKYENIYKTSMSFDYLKEVDKRYYINEKDIEYAKAFSNFLSKRFLQFEHDVFVALQNNLYKRFYEFDDIKNNK